MARSPVFDGVDPELLQLLQSVGGNYGPYKTNLISGYRAGDKRFHGKGRALDMQLIDPKTGAVLDNYQDGQTAGAYQQFANTVYNAASPEMKAKLRWGGYFSGGPGKYGALDLMHFDTAGDQVGMAGGSWAEGFNENQRNTWGIKDAGGLGAGGGAQGQMQAMAQAGYSPEQIKKAFLDTIASGESPGYDVLYGGEKFSDMSRHPGRSMPILDQQGQVTGHSSAAGRYQFLAPTWDEQSKKYGYKDFRPETQDAAAWNYANDVYKQKTGGGDLQEALASGDPARINAAYAQLGDTWTSLKKTGDKTAYDKYSGYLGQPTAATASAAPAASPGAFPPPPAAKKDKSNLWDVLGESMANAGKGMNNNFDYNVGPQPAAARVDAVSAPIANVDQMNMQRQQLAMAMAKLNSGRLYG